jgi:hypothetical protein
MNDDFFSAATTLMTILMTIIGIALLIAAAFNGSIIAVIMGIAGLAYPFYYITEKDYGHNEQHRDSDEEN